MSWRAHASHSRLTRYLFRLRSAKPKQSELEKQLQAFADSKFKGLRTWKTVFAELRAAGTKSLSPAAASTAMRGGGGPLAAPRCLTCASRRFMRRRTRAAQ